jgi:hypothetical protein
MIVTSVVQGLVKAQIAANPKFQTVTPELGAVVDAITGEIIAAVQQELTAMKTTFNAHTHVTGVGPTAPPVPPMT